ncbi:hypothetical protein [Amycolatopsis sp. 195334CR]|uniref:hypothetical protein n=1 Tax=Amycolatopsis sp. 195334CR TaxID=2814588 RepID=UPI001A8EFB09|nr:hypothetical protein [Amycolatopsis sp. 195334CR]MBN6035543.1 hypothetical protein [Amycolatopsis sp. 195334CR]
MEMQVTPNVDRVLREAQAYREKVQKALDDFVREVHEQLAKIPDLLDRLVEPVRKQLAALEKLIKQLADKVAPLFTHMGSPSTLRETADGWSERVNTKLAAISDDELLRLTAAHRWHSDAATAYRQLIPIQQKKLDEVADLAAELRSNLRAMANAIESFWTAVALGFASCATAVAGIVIATQTTGGLGTPLAVIGLVSSVVSELLDLITTAVEGVQTQFQTAEDAQAAITEKLTNLGTTWPKTTTDLSDASISDKDRSLWRLNT